MKKVLLLFFILFFSKLSYTQDYQLIPDSCTFCSFFYSQGGATLYGDNYHIDPLSDTIILGNSYKKVFDRFNFYLIGIRQVGNKLYGILDTIQEKKIMDFDANIGDTIYNLTSNDAYSQTSTYDAKVIQKDSTLLINGSYHHWMRLEGIRYSFGNSLWNYTTWIIKWNEKGLCNEETFFYPSIGYAPPYGGILFNTPVNEMSISLVYGYPNYCTSDPLHSNTNVCTNCILTTSGLSDNENSAIQVYPNPSTGVFIIETETSEDKIISIHSINGQLIQKFQSNNLIDKIDIRKYEKGVYFIKIKNDTTISTIRLVYN